MRQRAFSFPATSLALVLGLASASSWQSPATAQLPECAPPQAGEYLLLVVTESENDPEILQGLLTPQLNARVCTYLDEVVVRVQGFTSQEEAASLARLVTQESGLAAFVTRPPRDASAVAASSPPAENTEATIPSPSSSALPPSGLLDLPTVEVIEARSADGTERTPSTSEAVDEEEENVEIDPEDLPPATLPSGSIDFPPPDTDTPTSDSLPVYVPVPESSVSYPQATAISLPTPTPTTTAYNPQSLAPGYAVLVDYFNQTQIAGQLQQLTNQQIGLVSYGQRPFLLVGYTASEMEANRLFQQLSANGFWTMVVDSQRVTVIAPQVVAY
ncbi:MAG: hypothetical protein J7642_15000 [Cyanobacteria bacterium SBC]|nr:hypothetical protein [Cyanobacteria bacterium SBC]